MKKRVVQALGCILAMTMVVGSLTACGGKSEKKAEKKQACQEKIPSAVAKRAKRHPHTLLNPDLRFGFFQNGLQLSECIDTDTKSISIFTRF